jgi:hypothetical protein
MKHPFYFYKSTDPHRYTFTSLGRRPILKAVEFAPTSIKGLYNMAFGDVMLDGTLNDTVKSNNGDIIKVLSTVVRVAVDFMTTFPDRRIIFAGSTSDRTRLYGRILKKYYTEFHNSFTISALKKEGKAFSELAFNREDSSQYFAFIIEKIN